MPQPTILLLCGSLSQTSANRAALNVAAEFLKRSVLAGATNFENLIDVPPLEPDPDRAAPWAVAILRGLIHEAQGVLIAAPEYGGAIAGTIKNALDWIVGSGEFYAKPVALISAGTTGGVHARQMMAQTLQWQGARVVADLGISTPKVKSDKSGRIVDVSTIAEIERVVRVLVAESISA